MKISEARFAGSSTRISERPEPRLPEIAFIGRSNVGKSSLINMLCGNRKLAMTSATPGKTKLVNHFLINGSWYLVDLPGYGYARISAREKEKLHAILRNYLNFSREMTMLFVLVDSRHDIQKIDLDFMTELSENDIPFAVVFTKGDKLGAMARQRQIENYKNGLLEHLKGLPRCFESSSETGLGKEDILNYVDSILNKDTE